MNKELVDLVNCRGGTISVSKRLMVTRRTVQRWCSGDRSISKLEMKILLEMEKIK